MLATSALGGTKGPLYKEGRRLLEEGSIHLTLEGSCSSFLPPLSDTALGALVTRLRRNKDPCSSQLCVEITNLPS